MRRPATVCGARFTNRSPCGYTSGCPIRCWQARVGENLRGQHDCPDLLHRPAHHGILPTRYRPPAHPPPFPARRTEAELRALLETGTTQQRLGALRQLIELRAEPELTRCLGSADPAVVQLAITGLWECWLDEAGPDARRAMDEGVEAMNAGELPGGGGHVQGVDCRRIPAGPRRSTSSPPCSISRDGRRIPSFIAVRSWP